MNGRKQQIVISDNVSEALVGAMDREKGFDRLFVLSDETTAEKCVPLIREVIGDTYNIIIGVGDSHKTLESLSHVWSELGSHGATRHSLLINIGGGMVTDLGGFAASTFKRGISFINVPTTLLSMVDASVGGKTGINFGGLKNEIGVFSDASTVILDTVFLASLDSPNMCSGYAEMLKHGLISSEEMWRELISFDINSPDLERLRLMVAKSVKVKERIVERDPTEKGIRKALNLGHTVGHAFESLSLRKGNPVLHGYAVAWGIICELYLSVVKTGFPSKVLRQAAAYIDSHYGRMPLNCDSYDELYELMTHDKKNRAGTVIFTLLADIGDIKIDQVASKEEIFEALDFYREGR